MFMRYLKDFIYAGTFSVVAILILVVVVFIPAMILKVILSHPVGLFLFWLVLTILAFYAARLGEKEVD